MYVILVKLIFCKIPVTSAKPASYSPIMHKLWSISVSLRMMVLVIRLWVVRLGIMVIGIFTSNVRAAKRLDIGLIPFRALPAGGKLARLLGEGKGH